MPQWQTAMPVTQGPGGRIIGRGTWHTEEDEALKAAVKIHGTKSWAVVSTVCCSCRCHCCCCCHCCCSQG